MAIGFSLSVEKDRLNDNDDDENLYGVMNRSTSVDTDDDNNGVIRLD